MKRMIFGAIMIFTGIISITGIICTSMVSSSQYVNVLHTQAGNIFDFFVIFTIIGVLIFFYDEIKTFIKKEFIIK
ncbi:hypothetical protein KHQ82_10360 [Mycoplasmatota bacterium]|nr:hypothetical protein KHQ82_10360 [Mycoplasmatota bacterium]